jgi:TPR repeat protein
VQHVTNADAESGSPQSVAARGQAENPDTLYRAGRTLLALALIADGLGCIIRPWTSHEPQSNRLFFFYLGLAGLGLIASALGIAAGRRPRGWALILGAVTLLLAVPGGMVLCPDLTAPHFVLETLALAGAVWMLAGLESRREEEIRKRFQTARFVFAAAALACIVAKFLFSIWLESGFDMFYLNYDVATLFHSIWSWSYPLSLIFGALAAFGSAAILFRRLARAGAICLAAASTLFLPLLFLYRFDDFCGAGQALIELLFLWALDLGVAGGALIVAAALRQTQREGGVQSLPAAGVSRILARWRWVRIAMSIAAVVLLALILGHGLVPLLFYEANSRGDRKLGDLAARVYAATYVPTRGNSYLAEQLSQGILSAGPAGRSCAAGDPHGCAMFASFYQEIGWNWGRTWDLFARAATLLAARCDRGDAESCYNLGVQYDDGEGLAVDRSKAAPLYQKACDANEGDGCERLGDMYWYGIGFNQDKARGKALLKKGCDLGSQWACERLTFENQFEK